MLTESLSVPALPWGHEMTDNHAWKFIGAFLLIWGLVAAYWIAFAIQLATNGPIWPKYFIAGVALITDASLLYWALRDYKRA
jgi:hypothetical protein